MEARFKTLQTVWLALLGGVAAYTTAGVLLITVAALDVGVLGPSVLTVAAATVVVYMAGGLVVRRRMVDAIPAGVDEETHFARYQTATLVGLGLLESGGLLLVTLGLLANAPTWVLAGGAASLCMMTLARPRKNEARLGGAERG